VPIFLSIRLSRASTCTTGFNEIRNILFQKSNWPDTVYHCSFNHSGGMICHDVFWLYGRHGRAAEREWTETNATDWRTPCRKFLATSLSHGPDTQLLFWNKMFLISLNPVSDCPTFLTTRSGERCSNWYISPTNSWHRSLERRDMPLLGNDQPRLDWRCHQPVIKVSYDGDTGTRRPYMEHRLK